MDGGEGTQEATVMDAVPFLISVVVDSAECARGRCGHALESKERGIHLDNVQKALLCLETIFSDEGKGTQE